MTVWLIIFIVYIQSTLSMNVQKCFGLKCCFGRKQRSKVETIDASKLQSVGPLQKDLLFTPNSSQPTTVSLHAVGIANTQQDVSLGWTISIDSKGNIIKHDDEFNRIFDSDLFNYQQSSYWKSKIKRCQYLPTSGHRIIETKDNKLLFTVHTLYKVSFNEYTVFESDNLFDFSSINISSIDVVLSKTIDQKHVPCHWIEQFIWFYNNYKKTQQYSKEQWSLIQQNFLYYLDEQAFNDNINDDRNNTIDFGAITNNFKSLINLLDIKPEQFKINVIQKLSSSIHMPNELVVQRTIIGMTADIGRMIFSYNQSQRMILNLLFAEHNGKLTAKLDIKCNNIPEKMHIVFHKNELCYGVQFHSALKLLESTNSRWLASIISKNSIEIQIAFNNEKREMLSLPNVPISSKLDSIRSNIEESTCPRTKLSPSDEVKRWLLKYQLHPVISRAFTKDTGISEKMNSLLQRLDASANGTVSSTIKGDHLQLSIASRSINSGATEPIHMDNWLQLTASSHYTTPGSEESGKSNYSYLQNELDIIHNKTINVLIIHSSAQHSRVLQRFLKRFGENVHVGVARNLIDAEIRFMNKKYRWHLFLIEDMNNKTGIGEGRKWIEKNYETFNLDDKANSIYLTSQFLKYHVPKKKKTKYYQWLESPIDMEQLMEIWVNHGWARRTPDNQPKMLFGSISSGTKSAFGSPQLGPQPRRTQNILI